MKRLRRALLVLLSTIAVLAVAVIVLYFTLRAEVARYVIDRQLRGAGISNASFQIRRVSLDRIELRAVELKNPDWGSASTVSAVYSISSLLKGRIHSLTILNAQWRLDEADDKPSEAAGEGEGRQFELPLDLPLDQLTLRNVMIVVPAESGPQRILINGSIKRVSPSTFHVDLGVVGDSQVMFRHEGLEAAGLVMQVRLSVRSSRREIVIAAREGNIIGLDRISFKAGTTALDSTAVRLLMEQGEQEPLARIARGRSSPMVRVAAEFKSSSAITVDSNRGRIFVPTLRAAAQVESDPRAALVARMDIGVQGASLRSDEIGGFGIVGLNALIPIDFNVPVARRGPVSADAILWRGAQFEEFAGSLGAAEGFLDVDVEGSLGGGARLAINAGFDFSDGFAGDVAAFIPPFQLTDAENLRRIIPQLREAQIDGTYTMNAQFLLRDGAIDPYVHFKASNAKIYNTQWPLAIDSADADVVFTSLAPLRTPPGQRITVHQARVGKLEVDGGDIAFQVQDVSGTRVEDLRWSMGAYGDFRASPFSMHLLHPQFESTLRASNVGVGAWLDLLSDGRASSDGMLSGTIALRVDSSLRQPVRVLGGHLEGQPSAGNVAVEDARMLSRFLDRSAAHAVAQEQWEVVRTRLVDALADYRYSMLQVDFLPEDDDVTCRIQTSGRGRRGEEAQEIGLLTINVRHFNEVLNEVMLFHAAFSGRE
jgi:hypothetical protein